MLNGPGTDETYYHGKNLTKCDVPSNLTGRYIPSISALKQKL